MRLVIVLLFVFIFQMRAESTYSQMALISINMKNASVEEVLSAIEEKSEFYFLYNTKLIDIDRKVDVEVEDKQVQSVLHELFAETDVNYYVYDRQIVLSNKEVIPNSFANNQGATQQALRKLTGKITDTSGDVLIGATVSLKGTQYGTATDTNGNYSLDIPEGSHTLAVSFVGYLSQEIRITNQTSVNVSLEEDLKLLEEVVVIGYGTVAKKDVTTAVSIVSTKDLDERPISNAVQAIQGKAAGVYVYQPNGAPGADMVIRVRGVTSINSSNEPLYVVDGLPVSNLNFLSHNDIASMQILKDASSAAIYGSRAANGVVLITTKQGDSAGAKIGVSMQLSLNKIVNKVETLNALQYKELMDEIAPGVVPVDATKDITNWHDEVYQDALTQNYQLQISDGSQKLRYFISGGYQNQEGIIRTTYSQRYNLRANVESQIRSWLKFGANINYSDRDVSGITTGIDPTRGGLVLAVEALPTSLPVYNEEGMFWKTFYGRPIINPVEAISDNKDRRNRNHRLITTGTTTITFMKGLDLNTRISMDRTNTTNTSFTEPKHSSDRKEYGSASDNRSLSTVMTFDNVLTFKKSFGKHNTETMAGTSWTRSNSSSNSINGSHYRDVRDEDGNYIGIKTLNAANKIALNGASSSGSQWGIMSYFGRISYNFDSKYLLTANLRADGSSRLDPDNRWGYFPSVSAAWRLSSENFMQSISWLDDMKIRAGWGQTGNQSGINDFAYLQRYSISRQEWWVAGAEDFLVNISPSNMRNRELTWETTTQSNIGLDLQVLKNRLSFTFDYYYKYTTDMLMNVQMPTGAAITNTLVRNEGEMSNRGWEVGISSRNIAKKDFQWTTEFNISGNKNKLEKLALQKVYLERVTEFEPYVVRNIPGGALSRFWGYISDGVDPETGELMYRDVNQDGRLSASDKTYIGDANPDFTYGLTNTISYKGFNVNIFIQGSVGNDIYNASRSYLLGMHETANQSVDALRRWKNPGDITDIPKVGWYSAPSTFFVEDGSYLRLKELTISYNFKGESLKKMGVSRLQPYVTGRNLLTFTNYKGLDPEVNETGSRTAMQGMDYSTYPHCRVFLFGINVEF